jgi:glycosyltransferase involved in cell wall biosynthesis
MFLKKRPLLSVIIPVYNERPFIREAVNKLYSQTSKLSRLKTELLVVDDGSTDGTYAELQALQSELKELKVFLQSPNQGKGAALRRGIAEASGEFMIFQDADLEYDPADISSIMQPLLAGEADVVYGSRFAPSPARKILNFHHQAGNQLLTLLSNLATGLNLTDMETGYKAFRADILKTIPLRSNRFGIEPEITAKIAKRHCAIYEVPISYNGRSYGEGKKITWRDGMAAIYTIVKYWLIDDCYHKKQISETYNDLERTHSAQESLVLRLTPYFGDRLLEIGSGIGSISRILPIREKITLSDWRAEYLELLTQGFAGKNRVEIEQLDIFTKEAGKRLAGKFDSVLLLHQLQLCQNENLAMQNIHKLLDNHGRLILTAPGHKDFGSYEKQLNYQRRYNNQDLHRLLKDNGFKILQQFTANFPALMIWKHVLKKRKISKLPLCWAKACDFLVKKFAFFEKYFKLDGLTTVIIAEKEQD